MRRKDVARPNSLVNATQMIWETAKAGKIFRSLSITPWAIVLVASSAFAALYIVLDLNAFSALRTDQNTGLYLQSLSNFAHHGTTFDQPDGKPHMAAHNQWLALLLALPVAVWPFAQTLIVAQVVVLSAAAPVLYFFALGRGASPVIAATIAVAYLIAPSTQGWAYHGFVPEDALPLVAFTLAIAIDRRSLWGTIIAAQILLGIKEDECYFAAWIGVFVATFYDRRAGIALIMLGTLNGVGYYAIERAYGYWPERPLYGLHDDDVAHQLAFLVEILAPLAFAPLWLGVRILAIVPFCAELFLPQQRDFPMYQGGSYYTVPIVTLCTIGATIVLARRPRHARVALGGAIVMALAFNTTVLHVGRSLFSKDPQFGRAARYADTTIPVDFPCADVGAWTVAASDPNARLACPGTAGAGLLPTDLEPGRVPRSAWRDAPLDSRAAWTR